MGGESIRSGLIQAACGRMQFTHWLVLQEGSLFCQQTGTCNPATESWTRSPLATGKTSDRNLNNATIHVQILTFFSLEDGAVVCQIISSLHSCVWFIVVVIWVVMLIDKVNVCSCEYMRMCAATQYMPASVSTSCFSAVLQNSWTSRGLNASQT